MDWFTFIIEITKISIWPVTIMILAVLLHKPLGALIPGLQRVRWKDLEIDFGKKIGEIESKANDIQLPPQYELEGEDKRSLLRRRVHFDRFTALAEISPPAAVLESWLDVEIAILEAATRHGIAIPNNSLTETVGKLVQQNKLDFQTASIFNDLYLLRNEAIHSPSTAITTSQAREFRVLARRLAAKLWQL